MKLRHTTVINNSEENELLDRILAGEEQLYARLVNEYKRFAYTIAMKVLNNRADAEEVAQDAFVKAYHYLKGFNRQSRFSTWLYRIVFNTAISRQRQQRVVFEDVSQKNLEYREQADHATEYDDRQQHIARAMSCLNEADRIAIQLYYLKEFTLEETAGMLGQNLNTTKVRVHRARLRLAAELKRLLKQEALTL
jgi:RNA polymerase sigma-70 factor (ECF subfamily)